MHRDIQHQIRHFNSDWYIDACAHRNVRRTFEQCQYYSNKYYLLNEEVFNPIWKTSRSCSNNDLGTKSEMNQDINICKRRTNCRAFQPITLRGTSFRMFYASTTKSARNSSTVFRTCVCISTLISEFIGNSFTFPHQINHSRHKARHVRSWTFCGPITKCPLCLCQAMFSNYRDKNSFTMFWSLLLNNFEWNIYQKLPAT